MIENQINALSFSLLFVLNPNHPELVRLSNTSNWKWTCHCLGCFHHKIDAQQTPTRHGRMELSLLDTQMVVLRPSLILKKQKLIIWKGAKKPKTFSTNINKERPLIIPELIIHIISLLVSPC